MRRNSLSEMLLNSLLVWLLMAVPFSKCTDTSPKIILRLPVAGKTEHRISCTDLRILRWSKSFRSCFIDKQNADGGWNLENLVDRALELSTGCVAKTRLECRLNYGTFLVVMDKVIEQLKNFPENIKDIQGKNKIRDLDCIKRSLSYETYATCFKAVFERNSTEDNFQTGNVENAFFCTNKSNRICSDATKISLNRMVLILLRVNQTEYEKIKERIPWIQLTDPTIETVEQTSSSETSPVNLKGETVLERINTSPKTKIVTMPSPYSSPRPLPRPGLLPPLPPHEAPQDHPPKFSSHAPSPSEPHHPHYFPSPSPLPPRQTEHHHHESPSPPPPRQTEHHHHESPSPPPPSPEPHPHEHHQHFVRYQPLPPPSPPSPPPPTSPPPRPWRWYDYIIKPAVTVWNWVKGLFGF